MAVSTNRFRGQLRQWWAKGALAGIIGGIPMGIYVMLACSFVGLGLLYPPNAVATNWVRFRPAGPDFVLSAFLTGTIEHAIMAALWGIGLAAVLWRFGRVLTATWPRAVGTGLFWGLLAYSTTGVIIGPAISPDIMWIPGFHSFVGHLIYGLTTALVLRAWLVRPRLRVTMAPGEAVGRRPRVHSGEL